MPMISNISSSLDTGMGSPGTPKNEEMEKIIHGQITCKYAWAQLFKAGLR